MVPKLAPDRSHDDDRPARPTDPAERHALADPNMANSDGANRPGADPIRRPDGGGFWLNSTVKKAYAHKATEKIITIPPKSSTNAILTKLQQEGVISNVTAVSWWLRTFGRGKVLKTGDYQFDYAFTSNGPVGAFHRFSLSF